jgi:hypothetical protein
LLLTRTNTKTEIERRGTALALNAVFQEADVISAVAAMVCAFTALGRGPADLPAIELLDTAPPNASANVEGFVHAGGDTIFILTTSDTFTTVQRSGCGDTAAVKKLASIIAHEEWHVLHGAEEQGAYEAQLGMLLRLGIQPGSPVHYAVVRSMLRARRSTHVSSQDRPLMP